MSSNSDLILKINNISKSFPGVKALTDVSFSIRSGEIHALVGENGAGKSTLIKVLSGVYMPDSGSVDFDGETLQINGPLAAQKKGISVVHQDLMLVDYLSVAENIFMGRPKATKLGLVDWKAMQKEAKALLRSVNANLDVNSLAMNLSIAEKQLVEICKALSFNAKLVIMDEPSATLTEKELKSLYHILNTLREKGVAIIYISHRLEEVFEIADRVSVLRDGTYITTKDVSDTNRKELIALMVGRELGQEYPKTKVLLGDEIIRVNKLSRRTKVHDVSMFARKGEIVGIAGLVGAGRTEFARLLFGADRKLGGEIIYKGQKLDKFSVRQAIHQGIGLVPEDRKDQGLNLDMTIFENVSMADLDRVLDHGVLSLRKEKALACKYIDELRIVTPSESQIVSNLSGGNQQKVVLAKWLVVDVDLLIIDEPTRGIDVGAKAEVYRIMDKLVSQGKTIIMISSELPELIAMCDRIYVMHEGVVAGELERSEFTQERIMNLAT